MAEKEAVNQFDDEQIIEIEIERLRFLKIIHSRLKRIRICIF